MHDVVTIDHLTHSYPPARKRKESRIALNDLSFQIHQSEIFSLLGPNGSGKSTLFKILSTLLTPTSGNVVVLDSDLREIGRAHV